MGTRRNSRGETHSCSAISPRGECQLHRTKTLRRSFASSFHVSAEIDIFPRMCGSQWIASPSLIASSSSLTENNGIVCSLLPPTRKSYINWLRFEIWLKAISLCKKRKKRRKTLEGFRARRPRALRRRIKCFAMFHPSHATALECGKIPSIKIL